MRWLAGICFAGSLLAQTPPTNVSLSPWQVPNGPSSSFSAQAMSPNGAGNIASISLLFSWSATGVENACMVQASNLWQTNGNFQLLSDDATSWAPISTNIGASNSRCNVSLPQTNAVVTSGNTVTLNLNVAMTGAGQGPKLIYMTTVDQFGMASGPQLMGQWLAYAGNYSTVGDSVTGFSGVQGMNGWNYGYFRVNGGSPGQLAQADFQYFPTGQWQHGSAFGPPWTSLWASGGHPNEGAPVGLEYAVRRYTYHGGTTAGWIFSHLAKGDVNCGAGVTGAIYQSGTALRQMSVAANDNVGQSVAIPVTLSEGTYFDFALIPGVNDSCDSSIFTATIATGPNANSDVTDSVTDFSATQGTKGWKYGWVPPGAVGSANATLDISTFTQLTTWDGWNWVDGPHPPWETISADGTHPNTTGGQLKFTVRRWVSTFAGDAQVTTYVAKTDPNCGDGTTPMFFLNGKLLAQWPLRHDQLARRIGVFNLRLAKNDVLDFLLSYAGAETVGQANDGCDSTMYTANVRAAQEVGGVMGESAGQYSAMQGQDGWQYGWAGADGVFQTAGMTYNGMYWVNTVTPPAVELGPFHTLPKVGGDAVRRWVSSYAGAASIKWQVGKENPGCSGDGVTGVLRVNGAQRQSMYVDCGNTTGVVKQLDTVLAMGDTVDIAVGAVVNSYAPSDVGDASSVRVSVVTRDPHMPVSVSSSGLEQAIRVPYGDLATAAQVVNVYFRVTDAGGNAKCLVGYNALAGQFFSQGTSGCVFNIAGSSASGAGATLSVMYDLTFLASDPTAVVWRKMDRQDGSTTNWVSMGAWPIAAVPGYSLSLNSPGSLTLPLGQSATLFLNVVVVPQTGFTGLVTPVVTGLPAGVTATIAPANLVFTGNVGGPSATITLTAAPGAAFGASAITVTGGAFASQRASFVLNVVPSTPPTVTVGAPGPGYLYWGVSTVWGWAAAAPPGVLNAVGVTITKNDDTGLVWTLPSVYNVGLTEYSALWNSGLFPDGVTPGVPNGNYTVTAVAVDPILSTLRSSASSSFTVDNQTPSPVMVGPVNGGGLAGTAKVFGVQYATPHAGADFSGGQVVFTGMNATGAALTCTMSWTMPGPGHPAGTLTMLEGAGATGDFGSAGSLSSAGCAVSLAGSSLGLPGTAGNAANQVAVSLSVVPSGFLGAVGISASGWNLLGQSSARSNLTTYTVTVAPSPYLVGPSAVSFQAATPDYQLTVLNTNGGAVPALEQVFTTDCMSYIGTYIEVLFDAPAGVAGFPGLATVGFHVRSLPYQVRCFQYSVGGAVHRVDLVESPATTTAFSLGLAGPGANSVAQGGSWTFGVTPILPNGFFSGQNPPTVGYGAGTVGDSRFVWSLAANNSWYGPPYTGTIQVNPTTPPGTYLREFPVMMTVTPWDNSVLPTVVQNLVLEIVVTAAAQADFTVTNPTAESLHAGNSAQFSMLVTPKNGFSGTVTMAGSAIAAAGVAVSFPGAVTLNGSPVTVVGTVTTSGSTPIGTYSLPIAATGGGLTHSTAMVLKVQGGPLFSYTLSGPARVGVGSQAWFSVSNIVGGTSPFTYVWNWSGPASTPGSGSTGVFNTGGAGPYTATVTAMDATGLVVSKSAAVATSPYPSVTVVPSSNPASTGNTVTFTAWASGGTAPYTYSWDGPLSGNGNVASYVPDAGRTYLVAMVHVTDSLGISSTNGVPINVIPGTGPGGGGTPPPPPGSSFSLQWVGPTTVGAGGGTIGFARLVMNGGYSTPAAVKVTPGQLPAGVSASISDDGYQTYGVVGVNVTAGSGVGAAPILIPLTASDGAKSYTLQQPMQVAPPDAQLTVSAHVSYTAGGSITNLHAGIHGGVAPYSFVWTGSWGGGTLTTGNTDSLFIGTVTTRLQTPSGTGNLVTVTVTDSSPVPQVMSSFAGIASNPHVDDTVLYDAIFARVAAADAFGDYLDAHGFSSVAARSRVAVAAGLTDTQFAAVKGYTRTYRANVALVRAQRKVVVANIVAVGRTPVTANATELASLMAVTTSELSIMATSLSGLRGDVSGAFAPLDAWARNSVLPALTFDNSDPDPSKAPISVHITVTTDSDLTVDPESGVVDGWARALAFVTGNYYGQYLLTASVSGSFAGGSFYETDSCGYGCAEGAARGQMTSPGQTMTSYGVGSGAVYWLDELDVIRQDSENRSWSNSATWNPQPVITQVIPAEWQAGAVTAAVVCGRNFGTLDTVTASAQNGVSVVLSDVQAGSTGQDCGGLSAISFNATVGALPSGQASANVELTLGVTGWGNSWLPQTPPRTTATARVVGIPSTRLLVTNRGSPVSPNQCLVIDKTPQMPPVTATIIGPDGLPLTGTAQWRLSIDFQQRMRPNGAIEVKTFVVPNGPIQEVSAAQPWDVPWTFFAGGTATVNWSYNRVVHPAFRFCIVGTNPDFSSIDAELANVPYWMAKNIAQHETNRSNFCEAGRMSVPPFCSKTENANTPVWGYPGGYGIMQVDPPPSIDAIWNWKSAVTAGKEHLDLLAGPPLDTSVPNWDGQGAAALAADKRAYPFWIRQAKQAYLYNLDPKFAGGAVPPPQDQIESSCRFTFSPAGIGTYTTPAGLPTNTHWFGDAILIKQYGGTATSNGTNANYISWNNTDPRQAPAWSFYKPNSVSSNVVFEVCSCTSLPSCQHTNDGQ